MKVCNYYISILTSISSVMFYVIIILVYLQVYLVVCSMKDYTVNERVCSSHQI